MFLGRLRLRLVTSQGSPYPSRSPRAHPSGWARTQGLSRMDSHAPPFFWDDPRQDVELAAGSYFTDFSSVVTLDHYLPTRLVTDCTHAVVQEREAKI